ncbi:hypothetical protein KM176_22670 [Pseudooceanicola sp. CBS1P-1]|uniref:Glycosyltransferase family 8 protein n=1 Tax=Pseudooceanicola albus TaxID=2692189 RepID=A0A6L7GA59_9RHOB|nr:MULTISPECIES: glycosyltransferase [Pseudooceanicola]MBT9386673.1 hypothetical protein [Pseudooceanicola endophyticus]MXN20915.1 hypothetical protein [Pseudooceanicola albus]
MSTPTCIAFLTDGGFLKPTLVAMASVLETARNPVELHVTGWKLRPEDWAAVHRVAEGWPGHTLVCHELDEAWMRGASSPKTTIPSNALGKLFLPRLIGKRFLYIDGDTLVLEDLSVAMTLDMAGKLMAGVSDYVVSKHALAGEAAEGSVIRRVLGDAPMVTYVNSGVLLVDAPAILAQPALLEEMADLEAARGFGTVDQDRINQIFAGRMGGLDPAWNASWGRVRAHRSRIRRLRRQAGLGPVAEGPRGRLAILHFHGPRKPWHRLSAKTLSKGAAGVLTYRRFLRRFRSRFPDLAPS